MYSYIYVLVQTTYCVYNKLNLLALILVFLSMFSIKVMTEYKKSITQTLASLVLLLVITLPSTAAEPETHLHIGITPVFLTEHTSLLRDWQNYMELRLGHLVQFVQRGSYREITDMLLNNEIEFAWLCGYPYIKNRAQLQLVAVPKYQGEPYYRSYLIVSSNDSKTKNIDDLKGRVFAYSDPDSNSGFLVPRSDLTVKGYNPDSFFLRSFFTGSHRGVVEAVASELANGGSVDGYVWDTLALFEPELTNATRIVEKSDKFGFPPIVSNLNNSSKDVMNMRKILIQMELDPDGRELLKRLNIDGFTIAKPDLYDDIANMAKIIEMKQ